MIDIKAIMDLTKELIDALRENTVVTGELAKQLASLEVSPADPPASTSPAAPAFAAPSRKAK